MSMFSEAAGAAMAAAAAQEGGNLSQSGSNGGLHGPNGSNRDGVKITPKPDSVHTPLNLIPDSPDAAPVPPPADLTLLARWRSPARSLRFSRLRTFLTR